MFGGNCSDRDLCRISGRGIICHLVKINAGILGEYEAEKVTVSYIGAFEG